MFKPSDMPPRRGSVEPTSLLVLEYAPVFAPVDMPSAGFLMQARFITRKVK